jgi:uncharacterized membrane protein YqaE (UPF0057 family)
VLGVKACSTAAVDPEELLTLARALEVGMLDRFERDTLSEIERQITAADPQLAAKLRTGQQRLARAGTRTWLRMVIALLVPLAAVLLVLGVPASASAVAAVAAGLWWLRGYRFLHQEP